jgi:acetyl-CoA carboxylase biotin carboxyl carrier protein
MDLDRLQEILDWMAKSPVAELEISDGDFEVRLVRDAGGAIASTPAPAAAEASTGHEVVAASHGVIHLSPAPGSAPFVEVGQAVSVGQTLCVIEAMKVFSPIEADRAGTIAAILVADGAEVAAGQKLFRLD